VLGGHKDLYWFGQNVPTSNVLLLVLSTLVCSRGYKRAREGADPRSLVEGLKSAESLFNHVFPFSFLGRPTFPFIGEGEGAGYRERKREERGKAREKKASRATMSFFSFMRVPLIL